MNNGNPLWRAGGTMGLVGCHRPQPAGAEPPPGTAGMEPAPFRRAPTLIARARRGRMTRLAQKAGIEPRWEAAATLVSVCVLLTALPGRLRPLPVWVGLAAVSAVLVAMIAVVVTRGDPRALRVERVLTLLVVLSATVANVLTLGNLVNAMIYRAQEFDGVTLLSSSVAAWVTNVLAFSLLYWHIDRGGPEARIHQRDVKPDWLYPQDDAPPETATAGWRPAFVDYLFLAYSTATAFSTTDVMPLTPRAKMLMMLESTIALVTLVVVGARAINILGS